MKKIVPKKMVILKQYERTMKEYFFLNVILQHAPEKYGKLKKGEQNGEKVRGRISEGKGKGEKLEWWIKDKIASSISILYYTLVAFK